MAREGCLELTRSAVLNQNIFFFHVAVTFNILKNPVCGLCFFRFFFFFNLPLGIEPAWKKMGVQPLLSHEKQRLDCYLTLL